MKTITLTLDDAAYAHLEEDARRHGVTVESELQEIFRRREMQRKRPLIVDRAELLSEADAFHRDLAARGVVLQAEAVDRAIKEARR